MADELSKDEKKLAQPRKEKRLSVLERIVMQAMGEHRVLGNPEDPAVVDLPELWKMMVTVDLANDKVREPSTITIRMGPQGVLATLSDRSTGYSWDANSPTLAGIFQAIEQELLNPNAQVRSNTKKLPVLRNRPKRN